MSTSLSPTRSPSSPSSPSFPRGTAAPAIGVAAISSPFRTLAATLGVGLAVALGVSLSGFFGPSRPWSVAAYIVSVTSLAGLACARLPALRHVALQADVRSLLVPHTLRVVVGVVFLVLHARGALPGELAVRAGVGDIAVGLLAVPLLLAQNVARRALLAWNVAGLVDIVMVVGTAQKMLILEGRFAELAVLTKLPLALVPTMLVPIVLLTHVLVFVRVLGPAGRAR